MRHAPAESHWGSFKHETFIWFLFCFFVLCFFGFLVILPQSSFENGFAWRWRMCDSDVCQGNAGETEGLVLFTGSRPSNDCSPRGPENYASMVQQLLPGSRWRKLTFLVSGPHCPRKHGLRFVKYVCICVCFFVYWLSIARDILKQSLLKKWKEERHNGNMIFFKPAQPPMHPLYTVFVYLNPKIINK